MDWELNDLDLWCTAGVHPTSTSEIDTHSSISEGYLSELAKLVEEDRGEGGSKRIISVGEVGLGEPHIPTSMMV